MDPCQLLKWSFMKFLTLALFLTSFALPQAYGCSENGGFLPKNNLKVPVGLKSLGGISKPEFDEVLDKIEEIFASQVNKNGYRFKLNRHWTNPDVNASAEPSGALNFYGGLARYQPTTKDGFAMVACHEVGHLIGGAPKFSGSRLSAESQADYFASLKCLRQMFLNDNNIAVISKKSVHPQITISCSKAHPNKEEAAICIRSVMAGIDLGNLMGAALTHLGQVSVNKPDRTVVRATLSSYPATNQCRLDTFIQGALCEKSFNEDVSQSDALEGTCNTSTGHAVGNRPLCWYKPKA